MSLPCSQNSKYRKVVFHWHIQPYGLKFKCNIFFSPNIFSSRAIPLFYINFTCMQDQLFIFPFLSSCIVPMVDCILPEGMAHVFSNLYGFQCIDTSNDIDYFCYKSIQYTRSISHWQQKNILFFESKIYIKSSFLLIFMEAKNSYWWILVIS